MNDIPNDSRPSTRSGFDSPNVEYIFVEEGTPVNRPINPALRRMIDEFWDKRKRARETKPEPPGEKPAGPDKPAT
jgi:hypothetical protein